MSEIGTRCMCHAESVSGYGRSSGGGGVAGRGRGSGRSLSPTGKITPHDTRSASAGRIAHSTGIRTDALCTDAMAILCKFFTITIASPPEHTQVEIEDPSRLISTIE